MSYICAFTHTGCGFVLFFWVFFWGIQIMSMEGPRRKRTEKEKWGDNDRTREERF